MSKNVVSYAAVFSGATKNGCVGDYQKRDRYKHVGNYFRLLRTVYFGEDCFDGKCHTLSYTCHFNVFSFAVEDAEDNIVFEEGQGVSFKNHLNFGKFHSFSMKLKSIPVKQLSLK